MKAFDLVNAKTVDEAILRLTESNGEAVVKAGGTDLLCTLKGRILPNYPKAVINLITIPDLDYIKEDAGGLRIGALAKLENIAESEIVGAKYSVLAQAARAVANPILRSMGTLGGNLCQLVRCWYYRYPYHMGGIISCFRKGGRFCPAVDGDNRFHSIIGAKVCAAVCPSDTAIALSALDATIITNKREIPIGNFFKVMGNVLANNEIVIEVYVPEPKAGNKQTFVRFSTRKVTDFAIVSVAAVITTSDRHLSNDRIVVGAVAPVPFRASAAEDVIKGKAITKTLAETAATAAFKDAVPLTNNQYKIEIARTLVKRAILD
jgi:xanthine dehydrogenase YagS FAD-binding subunit